MQNVERDVDYIGLADGEYEELLPGSKARERRDATLNHCNSIREYVGPVWEVQVHKYRSEIGEKFWARSEEDVQAIVIKARTEQQQHMARWRREIELLQAETPESLFAKSRKTGIGAAWPLEYFQTVAYPKHQARARESREAYEAEIAKGDWPVEVRKVR
jgi:hypothetical protein